MSEHRPASEDGELEAYLDGQMTAEQRLAFEQQLGHDAEATRHVETQREIDRRLCQHYCAPEKTIDSIEQLIASASISRVHLRPRRWRTIALTVTTLAACFLVWMTIQNWFQGSSTEPYFEPRPLAQIYRETVRNGFRPYYYCEDDERFALTFEKRQGVPLRLLKLPADRRMIGLSYLGGLSRTTTAILCYVHDHPVVVFVDRREFDNQATASADTAGQHVYRAELGDLVLYEVSPLAAANMLDFLSRGGL